MTVQHEEMSLREYLAWLEGYLNGKQYFQDETLKTIYGRIRELSKEIIKWSDEVSS